MYTVRVTQDGSFYIGHPRHPGLAWSDAAGAWVTNGLSNYERTWPAILFDSEDAADEYATDWYLYPRID